MKKSLIAQASKIYSEQRIKRTWLKLISLLCCAAIFCTSYALILPAVSLGTDVDNSTDGSASFVAGEELLKTVDKLDGGDLSDAVHWIVEDVTDAFNVKIRQVRIYGEGEMPSGSSPWKSYSNTLQKVVIEDGITAICDNGFSGLTKVTSVELGNTVTVIGGKAFDGCIEITKINLPDSLREIKDYAFGAYGGVKITSLKLNEGLETLGVFGKIKLTALYIPKTVTKINYDKNTFAIDNCTYLNEIIVDEDNPVYKSDPEHRSILTKDGKTLIRLLRNATGSYSIPDGVTTLKTKAISNCNIGAVEFPDSVNNIEPGNFESCPNIKELNFPVLKQWKGNDYDNFLVTGCQNLIKVTFKGFDNGLGTPVDYKNFANCSLYNCPSLKEIVFPDEVYENVTTLGQKAFMGTSVSGELFSKFTNLQALNNGGAYPVDSAVFDNCNSVSKIVLGEKLSKIQNGVFNNCLNVKEIILNSKNLASDFKKTSASTQAFQNLISCSKLTIGKTVDKLNAALMNAIFDNDIKDVVFEGPNVLEIDAGIDAPTPINELGGTYFADADGVLYKLENDGESNMATLAYFPTGYAYDSYTVPDTITANDVIYNVTAVGKAAFKDALLKSVSFTNASAVSLLNDAFYDCAKLESVNGVTELTAAKALFSSVSSGAFFGTKISGDTEKNMGNATTEALSVMKGDETSNFKISIANGNADSTFSLYTDQTQTVNVSVSNSNNTEESIGRTYIRFGGSNYNLPSTVGETLNNSGYEYTFCKSDIEGIYYYEFKKPASGVTGAFSFLLSYPSPESAGGVAQIWSEIFTQNEIDELGNGVRFTDAGEYYHEYEWKTVPRSITVDESVSGNGSLIGSGENDRKSYVDGMKFKIFADSSNTGRADIDNSLANDLIKSFDFTMTLTLPEDFRFDDDIKTAVNNGNCYYANKNVYVTVGGKSISIMEFSVDVKNISVEFSSDNDKQLAVKYSLLNSSKTAEISDYSFETAYKKGLFYTDKAVASGDTFTFDNKVDVVNNYTYSEPKNSTNTAAATVTAGAANLTLTKTYAAASYLSDIHKYTVKVSNTSASTYPDFGYVTDSLPQYVYIPAKDIQKMMSEEYGSRLSVTVSGAEIAQNSSDISGNTVKSVDGNDCKITNQNTGCDIPYNGNAAQGTDVDIVTGTIRVYWQDGVLYAEYDSVKRAVDTSDSQSLENILDEFGYFVTRSAKYVLKWDFSNDFVMYGGKSFELNVYSKAMDTFMMLYYDHDGKYINDFETFGANTAYAYDSANAKIATSSTTKNEKHYREMVLKHAMFKNGKAVDGNSGLADGDIIQQTALFKHFGAGTYGALPLVNKISENQRLLVRKDLNESNTQLASFETVTIGDAEYYVLKYDGAPQTLTNVYTGENQLAAKISLSSAYTLVHWYFDNLPASTYVESVDYLTKIDTSNESEVKWNINVESWLNDHQTHRLHLKGGADGISLDFDKKIVTNPTQLGIDGFVEDNPVESAEFNTLNENQALDTFSFISEGNKVTYLLQLKSRGSDVTVRGGEIYDCMPWKYDWQKADVCVNYVYDANQVTVTNPQSWEVTKDDPSTLAEETDGDYSYIVWTDDFTVKLKGGAKLFMYVTLSFPTDNAWDSLTVANNGATLYNRFYLLGVYREVSHELKLPVKAKIQKGVYELGSIKRRVDSNGDLVALDRFNELYKSDGTRQYYMNTDSRIRLVTYYAIVCNSGQNKMYLNEMQDMLPKGFKYLFLANSANLNSDYMNTGMIVTKSKNGYGTLSVPFASIDGAELVTATVAASVSNRSENYQKVTFKFSKADSVSGEKTLKYDETYGKYYLNPGEAICFGYVCSISAADKTTDTATNHLALPLDDMGEGVFVNSNPVVASDKNGLVENDGSCDVIGNDIAESLGFNGYSADTKWYKSEVSVIRGEIVPEIGKKAIQRISKDGDVTDYSGFARSDDKITWRITAQNSGEYSLTDYTLSDTVQKMDNVLYKFDGYVGYTVYDKGAANPNYEGINLFRLDRESDVIKAIKTSGNDEKYGLREKGSTANLSSEIEVEYGKEYEGIVQITIMINTWRRCQFYFKIDKNENGTETLSLTFAEDIFSIPAGGRVEIKLTVSRTDQTNTTSGHFRNDVQLIPNAENPVNGNLVNYDRVISSDKVRQNDNVIGVANSSSFDIVNGYGTTSVKTVTELDSGGNLTENNASSEDDNNTITLSSTKSKFEYKSSVHLPKEVDTKELVIIDTLPQVGDHSVFEQEDSRGSRFKVDFVSYIPVVELVDSTGTVTTLSAGTDYNVDYSSKTVFDSDDWMGTSTFDSTVDPSTHRAIRLRMNTIIPKDATINLYYRATASSPETVNEGDIAYSSFGYSYQVNVDGFARQEAAPLKVGVRASNIAYLSKQLLTRDGTAYTPKTDETFKFIVYKGGSVNLSGDDESQLAQKLNGVEYTVVTLTVKAGESQSESVALSGLKQYTYSEADGFTEGTADWELTANQKYTVYEYSFSDAYLFKDISKNDNSNYTFTYMPETAQRFVCENILKTWQLSIVKKDADDENVKLQGAVFGLYSTEAFEAISDEALASLVADFGLDGTPSKTETAMINDVATTVYLKAVSSTDELGVVSWIDLINPKYAVKELKAPDGYIIGDDESTPNLRLISQPEVILLDSYTSVAGYTNKTFYSLPNTGGMGNALLYAIGVLLIAFSAFLYGKRRMCGRRVE